MPKRLLTALTWPVKQARGALANARDALTGFTWTDLVPPTVVSTVTWTFKTIPRSLGLGASPRQQITAAIAAGVAMVVASLGLLTYVGIAWIIVFGGIGALRLVPAVNSRYPSDASRPTSRRWRRE